MAESTLARIPQNPLEYYESFTDSPHLKDEFHDIDNECHFQAYLQLLQQHDTQNFMLDFGNDDAWCARNLGEGDFTCLLRRHVCYHVFVYKMQVRYASGITR